VHFHSQAKSSFHPIVRNHPARVSNAIAQGAIH
jgi:hypothetical protein